MSGIAMFMETYAFTRVSSGGRVCGASVSSGICPPLLYLENNTVENL